MQMIKLKKTLQTLKYALPFAVASFFAQQAKGQDVVDPKGVLNPFLSPDTTATAIAHNNIKTISERNRVLREDVIADWTYTIPPNADPVWNCNNWTLQMLVNSHDWGEKVYDGRFDNRLLYWGYRGFVLSEIYANGGTLRILEN